MLVHTPKSVRGSLAAALFALLLLPACSGRASSVDVSSSTDTGAGPAADSDWRYEADANGASAAPNGNGQHLPDNEPGAAGGSNPVPEPGTMLLCGSGLLGVALARRRRRAKPEAERA